MQHTFLKKVINIPLFKNKCITVFNPSEKLLHFSTLLKDILYFEQYIIHFIMHRQAIYNIAIQTLCM